MQYSPKLKKAMDRIKEILEEEDIAGLVVIHTPGYSEYLCKLNPGYSCAVEEQGGIRIRAKKDDYKGREKERDQKLADTSNMFRLLTDTMVQITYPIHEVADKLDELLRAEHTEEGHTSHDTQNN